MTAPEASPQYMSIVAEVFPLADNIPEGPRKDLLRTIYMLRRMYMMNAIRDHEEVSYMMQMLDTYDKAVANEQRIRDRFFS
jgi:hypothetical protein